MSASFIDTNVLVYLASSDRAKAEAAERVVADGGAISVQVLNELANVARRGMRMSWQDAGQFLATVRDLVTVHPVTIETHDAGMSLAQRYDLSLYDAMIAASALHARCDTLWSEDFQHGMRFGDLRVMNPFIQSA